MKMEGYVVSVNRSNETRAGKKVPFANKTNLISSADVKQIMKKATKVSKKDNTISQCLRKDIRNKRQSTVAAKENTEVKNINVNCDTKIMTKILRQKEKQTNLDEENKSPSFKKIGRMLGDIEKVNSFSKDNIAEEHIRNKVKKDIKRRKSFVQLEPNETIKQKMQENLPQNLKTTKEIVCDIDYKSCRVILEKSKYIENKVIRDLNSRKAFVQLEQKALEQNKATKQKIYNIHCKTNRIVLDKDKFVDGVIESNSKQKVVFFSDSIPQKILKTNLLQKNVRFVDNCNDMEKKSERGRLLRKRNSKQNYAEVSLNETKIAEPIVNKINVPIYRRLSLLKESDKKKKVDVYELDCSSDDGFKKRRRRRKKLETSINTSVPFERYMKVIINKLEEKHKGDVIKVKKVRRKVKKQNNKKSFLKTNDKQSTVSIKSNSRHKKTIQENVCARQVKSKENVQKSSKVTEVILCNLPSKEPNIRIVTNEKEILNKFKNNLNIPTINIMSNVLTESSHNKNRDIITSKNNEQMQIITETSLPDDVFNDETGHESDRSEVSSWDENYSNVNPLNQNKTNKIGNEWCPIANSTMTNNGFQGISSPWRLNLEVQRNPHFLQFKNTFLPNYNQEMVLQSSMIEKSLNETMNETKIVERPRKQTSILKFISQGKNTESLDTVNMECSLFDEHKLSPQKRINNKKKSMNNKENINQNIRKKDENVHKNVFEHRMINTQNVTTRRKIFGFDNLRRNEPQDDKNYSVLTGSSTDSEFLGFDNSQSGHNGKLLGVDSIVKSRDCVQRNKKVERIKRNILGSKMNEQNVMTPQKDSQRNNHLSLIDITTSSDILRKFSESPIRVGKDSRLQNNEHVKENINTLDVNVGDEYTMSPQKEAEKINRLSSSNSSINSCFFGFDNSESNIQTKDPKSKPFRVDAILPQIIKAQRNILPIIKDDVIKKNKEKPDKGAYLEEVGLFEDYQPKRNLDYSNIKQYKCRKPRRRRSPSPATSQSEDEDCQVVHRVKRKKNLRTKEEEAEANKWASEFNQMCEEIEKYPLEVE